MERRRIEKDGSVRIGCLAPIGAVVIIVLMLAIGLAKRSYGDDGFSVGCVDGHQMVRLCAAIAQVESDRGETSGNVYQITPEYVADVNRIQRKETRVGGANANARRKSWRCEDALSMERSKAMMRIFWAYYARRLPNGGTAEELAKIHHVGYRGLRTKRTEAEVYWRKVRRALRTVR